MRILLIVHAFNSLSQRLYVELRADGHELAVELDIHDDVTLEAVALFRPDVVLAPYLKRPIPAAVWRHTLCLVIHPGPIGDRGPASLDWAILRGERQWGVTVLQAEAALDAGAVWATTSFEMRSARKSSLYHQEVTEAAVTAVRAALARVSSGCRPLVDRTVAAAHPLLAAPVAAERAIDWVHDDTAVVVRKIHSADGSPGVADDLLGQRFRLYDASAAVHLTGRPGEVISRHHEAICRATRDGAVWIGELRPMSGHGPHVRQPAVRALGAAAQALPVTERHEAAPGDDVEVEYREQGAVGYLHFRFYNGTLSTAQCARVRHAYAAARARPTRVIVLCGGDDYWCNGMHLHCIEAAAHPADASWENISAINDFAHDILTTERQLTVAALAGNAAAGGVFLALAADRVVARTGIVLNPHYRNMGNLHGSEYWTYVLPRRVGAARAAELIAGRVPIGTVQALSLGLIDAHAGPRADAFKSLVETAAQTLAAAESFAATLAAKHAVRIADEAQKPLADYRREELLRMHDNFYGFDPSYHIARHRFVHHTPSAWTPLHLATHRAVGLAAAGAPVDRL